MSQSKSQQILMLIGTIVFFGALGLILYFIFKPSDECGPTTLWDPGACTRQEQENIVYQDCKTYGGAGDCLVNCTRLIPNEGEDPCIYFKETPCILAFACDICTISVPLTDCYDQSLLGSALESIYCEANDDLPAHNCEAVCKELSVRGEYYLTEPSESDPAGIARGRCDVPANGYNYCVNTVYCSCSADTITGCVSKNQLDIALDTCIGDECERLCQRYADLYPSDSCSHNKCRNKSVYCCTQLAEEGNAHLCEDPYALIDIINDAC